jgi:hypothetical protein
MARGFLAAMLCAAALSLAAGEAFAAAAPKQTPASQEAAVRYQRGIGLYKDGDYSAALAEFRAAYRALPSWEVLYNIGLCERRLFKYGDSVKNLESYLSQGGARVPKDRRDAVAKELSEIRALTAQVTISVPGEPADVTIDGEPVGSSPFKEPFLLGPGKKIFRAIREGQQPSEKSEEIVSGTQVTVTLAPKVKAVEPGVLALEAQPKNAVIYVDGKLHGTAPLSVTLEAGGHLITAEAQGYQSYRQEVTLAEGQKREVSIYMDPEVTARKKSFPVAGVIVGGLGLGAIGGAVALNLHGQAQAKRVSDLFTSGGTWDASYAAIEKDGQGSEAWSIVIGVAGGVALTTGVILTLVTLGSEGEVSEEVQAESAGLFLTPLPEGGAYGGLRFKW